jgi:hypothetical protein
MIVSYSISTGFLFSVERKSTRYLIRKNREIKITMVSEVCLGELNESSMTFLTLLSYPRPSNHR